MRAVVVKRFGDPPVLSVVEVATPKPCRGQIRLAVAAAGVNPVDVYNTQDPDWAGIEVGCVPGYDVAGTIDEVGPGVDPLLIGRRAMAMTAFPRGQGAYAEFAVVDEALAAMLPDDVDLVAAASVPLAAGTAREVVESLAPAGPSLLVIGASGGVGLFVLQLAAARGLQPIGLGRARSHEVMRQCGAADVVDYTEPNAYRRAAELAGGAFHAIADLVGGPTLTAAHPFLRDDGRIAAIATPDLDIDRLVDHNQTFRGILIRDDGPRLRQLAEMFAGGRLQTHVTHTLGLDEVSEAHRLLTSGEAAGKVVLTP